MTVSLRALLRARNWDESIHIDHVAGLEDPRDRELLLQTSWDQTANHLKSTTMR
jgi:hypothetical protein